MSVSDIAFKLGISPSTYAAKENGKIEFKLSECIKLAGILKRDPEDIFFNQYVSFRKP